MQVHHRHTVAVAAIAFVASFTVCLIHADPGGAWLVTVGLMTLGAAGFAAGFTSPTLARIARESKPSSPARSLRRLALDVACLKRSESEARERIDELGRAHAREQIRQRDGMENTVHELRTPLTTILASVEMIRSGFVDDPVDRSELVNQAHSACHHMLFVINDMLDAAAIRTGDLKLDLQARDLDPMLENAHRILEPMALVQDVQLRFEPSEREGSPPIRVVADEMRTTQVLFNLVGNAVKFSPPGSTVAVRASQGDDGFVTIEVEDDGPGVAEERRQQLFARFSRVHDKEASSATGSGIGLNFSQTLVDRMGGSIGYRPRENAQGSIFWFALPTTETERSDQDREAEQEPTC